MKKEVENHPAVLLGELIFQKCLANNVNLEEFAAKLGVKYGIFSDSTFGINVNKNLSDELFNKIIENLQIQGEELEKFQNLYKTVLAGPNLKFPDVFTPEEMKSAPSRLNKPVDNLLSPVDIANTMINLPEKYRDLLKQKINGEYFVPSIFFLALSMSIKTHELNRKDFIAILENWHNEWEETIRKTKENEIEGFKIGDIVKRKNQKLAFWENHQKYVIKDFVQDQYCGDKVSRWYVICVSIDKNGEEISRQLTAWEKLTPEWIETAR